MPSNQLDFQNFFSSTLASTITASDTVVYLNSLPTPSEGYLVIEPDSTTAREVIYYTSKGANYVTCPSVATGRGVGGTTASSHSGGATVQMNVVAEDLRGIQTGESNTGMHTYFDESFRDYVLSGGTVAQATGLIASISSGVAYINGRRLTFGAMTKTFTASKDTYVDLIETDGSNIATVSYTELASGATGSSPVSNGMHIGVVNSSASAITTISQTSTTRSNDYLGYPLFQTTPNRRIIGYAQITSNATSSGTGVTAVAGLQKTVIVPAGAVIKISVFSSNFVAGSANQPQVSLWDGASATGTQISGYVMAATNTDSSGVNLSAVVSNAAGGTKVYSVGIQQPTSGTATLAASATQPAYILIEIM